MHDQRKEFINSVERGWYQLHLGLGKNEEEHNKFLESLEREISE